MTNTSTQDFNTLNQHNLEEFYNEEAHERLEDRIKRLKGFINRAIPVLPPFDDEYEAVSVYIVKRASTDGKEIYYPLVSLRPKEGSEASSTTTPLGNYIASCVLGRRLTSEETVMHLDGDEFNVNLDNLVLRTMKERFAKKYIFTCPRCGKKFLSTPSTYSYDLAEHQIATGEKYCSNKCSMREASKRKQGETLQRSEHSPRDFYEFYLLG